MFPEPFLFLGIPIRFFSVFAALGVFSGYFLTTREMQRVGLPREIAPDLALAILLPSFLTARVSFVLLHMTTYASSPFDVFKFWEGGLVLSGGLLGGMLGGYFFCTLKQLCVGRMADVTAPGIALGLAVGRLGCWCAGCCFGKPTQLPWGIAFRNPLTLAEPLNAPLHPTQLYAFLIGLLIFAFVIFLRKRKEFEGEVMLVYLVLISGARMFLDLFRGDSDANMTLLALFIFTFGTVWFLQLKIKQRSFMMERLNWAIPALLVSTALIAACGIVKTDKLIRGHNILQGDVNTIQKGITTEKGILKLFGPPTKVRDTAEGKEFLYEYSQSGGARWDLIVSIGGSSKTKSLLVWLDKNGIVTDYAFKTT